MTPPAAASSKRGRTAIVCGGGIAGLTCALCLARAGFRVEVLEKAGELEVIGAGLQLSPNAMAVLAELDLSRQLKAVSAAPLAIDLRSARSGRRLASVPLGEAVVARYGQPYLVVHRGDLQQVLASACQDDPEIQLRLGVHVRDAVRHPNGVSVLADHEGAVANFQGQVLIGADGVHSTIRRECIDEGDPTYSGIVALRGLIARGSVSGRASSTSTQLWIGRRAHAVTYPVRAGRYLNVVILLPESEPDRLSPSEAIEPATIVGRLRGWNRDFTDLIDAETTWTQWPIWLAPRLRRWHEGNIALIGDAAHAMTPFAAQGAAMAIEDAAVLAGCLAGSADTEAALGAYEAARKPRVARVQRLTAQNQQIYHMGAPLSLARNLVMMMSPGDRLLARQDWIYRWRPADGRIDAGG